KPTGDGQPEARHRTVVGDAGRRRLDLAQPAVDGAGHDAREGLFALGCARVALEEEAFQVAQFGATQVGPHRGEAFGRIRRYLWHQSHLAKLGFLDDGDQQFFSRTEVMQQHSVTSADGGGYVAEGPVADAAPGEL